MWKVAGGFVDSAVAEIRAEAASGLLSPQHHAGHLEFPADGQLSPMGLGVDAMDVWHDNASPVGGGDDSAQPSLMGQHPPAELPPLGGHGAPAYGASPIGHGPGHAYGHGHGHGFDHRRPLDSSDWGSGLGSRGQAAGGAAVSTGASAPPPGRAPKRQAADMDGSDAHSMELHMPLTHRGAGHDRTGSSGSDPAVGRHSKHGSSGSHISAILSSGPMPPPPLPREAPHGFRPPELAGASTLSERVLGRPRALGSDAAPPALPSRQHGFAPHDPHPPSRAQQAAKYHHHQHHHHHQQQQQAQQQQYHHHHHAAQSASGPAAWAAQPAEPDAPCAPRKPAGHPSHGDPSPHHAHPASTAKRPRTDCVDVASLIAGRSPSSGLLSASASGTAAPALVAAAQSLAKHGASSSVSGGKPAVLPSRRPADEDDEDEDEEEEDLAGATPARRNEAKERRRQRKNDRERRRRQEVSGAMDDLADVVQSLTGTARRNKSDKVTVLLGALRAIHGLTEGLRAVTSLVQSASHGPSKHQSPPPVVTEETAGIMAAALGSAPGRR
ncbi:hypothetical protein FNF27_06320 [Cafeteria roenbergensis]|uniref:BHLH domain-containing protein n=1 Tax=Cafeteria roenbergensis TaxID=33653 RepID=A0A5A8DBS6_CAFRO|nr:hypothetical protein FNF31_03019 [Cafeteria roenbergensis]KAA0164148.1 hypothetical protein FNF28_03961 [Cafeteria roenbergensis]KAA0171410.1 hypothetical protein FNF27_06320 [Cafeteria roenbergensis]